MIIDPADLIAIRRAADTLGRDAAMIELRRRYLGLTDQNAPAILDRLLVLQVTPPPPHVGHGVAKRDAPGHTRRNGKRT